MSIMSTIAQAISPATETWIKIPAEVMAMPVTKERVMGRIPYRYQSDGSLELKLKPPAGKLRRGCSCGDPAYSGFIIVGALGHFDEFSASGYPLFLENRCVIGIEKCDGCGIYSDDWQAWLAVVAERVRREEEFHKEPVLIPVTDDEKLAAAPPIARLIGPVTLAMAKNSEWPPSELLVGMIRGDTNLVIPGDCPSLEAMEKFVRLGKFGSRVDGPHKFWPGYDKWRERHEWYQAVENTVIPWEAVIPPAPVRPPVPAGPVIQLLVTVTSEERGTCSYWRLDRGHGNSQISERRLLELMDGVEDEDQFMSNVREHLEMDSNHGLGLENVEEEHDGHDDNGDGDGPLVELSNEAVRQLRSFFENNAPPA